MKTFIVTLALLTTNLWAAPKPNIDVKDVNAKGSDGRLVEIEPNLVSWLEDVPKEKREGPVLAGREYKEFRKALGVTGKHDIFRHSFATYHFHHFKSIDQTMVQLGHSNFHLSQMYLNGEGIEQDRVVANVWATVAFAKRIEGAGEILLMLNKELTEEEIDQSIQILTEINKDHPEMLGG